MKKTLEQFAPNVQISTDTILKASEEEHYKNVLWTTEIKQELPIFLGNNDVSSTKPLTIMEIFEEAVNEDKENKCMYIEREGQWVNYSWNQFYKYSINFAKAVISIGVEAYHTVNILGMNAPEWHMSFIGGNYACVVPVGVYPTNNSETCCYIANHSDCGVLVVDSIEQYKKYEARLGEFKKLKAVVIWGTVSKEAIKQLINQYAPVYSWSDFLSIGSKATVDLELQNRVERQKPGNCCNVVYTSGTTGFPKAVLLSHDNMTFTGISFKQVVENIDKRRRLVSYLPLSHIAAQIFDIICKKNSLIIINFYYYLPLIISLHYQQKYCIFRKTRCSSRLITSNSSIC